MATFTIDSENNIAAHVAAPANIDNLQAFATEKDLASSARSGLTRGYPTSGTTSPAARRP